MQTKKSNNTKINKIIKSFQRKAKFLFESTRKNQYICSMRKSLSNKFQSRPKQIEKENYKKCGKKKNQQMQKVWSFTNSGMNS